LIQFEEEGKVAKKKKKNGKKKGRSSKETYDKQRGHKEYDLELSRLT
jgi:hypothetical protein